ncbi:heme oxygenase-like protein [Mycena olivaceomarginata]|nr:heme oxygenase-like protein [Mycena olivaceomarginata]
MPEEHRVAPGDSPQTLYYGQETWRRSFLKGTPSYADAVAHPFLRSAGDGTIDKSLFCLWLAQDRIYAAYAYPKFIGGLVVRIPFSRSVPPESGDAGGCLGNIVKEVEFFMTTARTHGLDLGVWEEREGTREYVAEMARMADGENLGEGRLPVYLDAWTFVRAEARKRDDSHSEKSPTDALVWQFVENWTSPGFVEFVDELAALANATDVTVERATEIWDRVLELEKGFWPVAGEDPDEEGWRIRSLR